MSQSSQSVEELYEHFVQTASNIVFYYSGDERKNMLKELREIVQKNCEVNLKLSAAEEIRKRVLNAQDIEKNERQDIRQVIKRYQDNISAIDVDTSSHQTLLDFDKDVDILLQDVDKDASAEENDEDEELRLTHNCVTVIDPISKKRIVNPVKNMKCGHTYDRETITAMLKITPKTRCPVVGCKNTKYIQLINLKLDIVTKSYLERHPT